MKKNIKRILALIGALFFIGLYAFTFIVAFLDFPYKDAVLQSCLFTTFFLAIFIAVFAAVFRLLKRLNGSSTDDDTSNSK